MDEPRAGGGEDDVNKLLEEVGEAGRSPLKARRQQLHHDTKHTEHEALLVEVADSCPEQEEKHVALPGAQGRGEFDVLDTLKDKMVAFSAAVGVRVDTETIAEAATSVPMTETIRDNAGVVALFDLRCSIEGDCPAMDGGKTGVQLCREFHRDVGTTEEDIEIAAQFDLRSSIETDYPATEVVNSGAQLSIALDLDGEVADNTTTNVALQSHKLPALPPAEKVADLDINALEIELAELLASTRFSTKNDTITSPATATSVPAIDDDVGASSLPNLSTTETEFSTREATEEAIAGAQLCTQLNLDEGVQEQFPAVLTPRLSKLLAVLRAKRRRLLRGGFRSLLSFREKAVFFEFEARLRAKAHNISYLEEQLVAERTQNRQKERASREEVAQVERAARAESQRTACAKIEQIQRDARTEAKRLQLTARIENQEVKEAARAEIERMKWAGQMQIEGVTRAARVGAKWAQLVTRAEAKRVQLDSRAEVRKAEEAALVEAERVDQAAQEELQQMKRDTCAEFERIKRAGREEAKRVQLANRAEAKRVQLAHRAEIRELETTARIENEEVEEAARAEVQRVEWAYQAEIERVRRASWAEARREKLAARAEVRKVEQASQEESRRSDQAAWEEMEMKRTACAEIERMERASRAEAKRVQLAAREENEEVKEAARAEVQPMEGAARVEATFHKDVPLSVFRHILLRPSLYHELLAVVSERKARQELLTPVCKTKTSEKILLDMNKKVPPRQLFEPDKGPGAGAAFFVAGHGGSVVFLCAKSVFWDHRIVYADVSRGLPALGRMAPSAGLGWIASGTIEEVDVLNARGWPSTSAALVRSGRYSSIIAGLEGGERELHEGTAAGTGVVVGAPQKYEKAGVVGLGGQEGTRIDGGIDVAAAIDLFGEPVHEWRLFAVARKLIVEEYFNEVPPIPSGMVYPWSGHAWSYSQVRTILQAVSAAGRAPSVTERTAVVPFVAVASAIGGVIHPKTFAASAVIEIPPCLSNAPLAARKTPSEPAVALPKRPVKEGRDKGRRAVSVAQDDTGGLAKRTDRSTAEQRPSDPTLTEKRLNGNGDSATTPAVSDAETEPPQVETYGPDDAEQTRASPTASHRLTARKRRISGVIAVLRPLSSPAVDEIAAHIVSYYTRILETDGGAAAEDSQDGTASSTEGTFSNPAVADVNLGAHWERAKNFREIERILCALDDEDYGQFEEWLIYARRALNSKTSKGAGGSKELRDDPPYREQFDFSLAKSGDNAKTPFVFGSGASVLSSSQTVRFGEAGLGTARAPGKLAPPVKRSAARRSTSAGRPLQIAAPMLAAASEAEGGLPRSLFHVDQPMPLFVEGKLRPT